MKCDYNSMTMIIIIILFIVLFYNYSKKENFITIIDKTYSLDMSQLGEDGEMSVPLLAKKIALDQILFN